MKMKMTGALHRGWYFTKIQFLHFFYSEEQLTHVDDGDVKKDCCDTTGQEEVTLSSLSLDTDNSMVAYDQTQAAFIPSHYIRVIEEPMEWHSDKKLGRKSVGPITNCASTSTEAYEKATAKHGDKTFYKFHKRLSRCPEQVLRCVSCD